MFYDDILLVRHQIERYGIRFPFVELGGIRVPTIARYELTMQSGDQHARYISLPEPPFTFIEKDYLILNPDKGDPPIEDLPAKYLNHFGTAVCLNVIEHVVNPFEVFKAIYAIMQKGGLVIITTVFSFPPHNAPRDFFRYSPECLEMLGQYAGFEVLEFGYHLKIWADEGIREIHSGKVQEIMATFCTLRKP